ncbi:MAG: hypothetical protein J3K34DRAFT_431723 [Monoraphidium minutum]|nr:MAG: hypothetical protein J3K34DRAFT_431723 [Monoraphidium minutum]
MRPLFNLARTHSACWGFTTACARPWGQRYAVGSPRAGARACGSEVTPTPGRHPPLKCEAPGRRAHHYTSPDSFQALPAGNGGARALAVSARRKRAAVARVPTAPPGRRQASKSRHLVLGAGRCRRPAGRLCTSGRARRHTWRPVYEYTLYS